MGSKGRAIGGYVRRSQRRYVPPAPDDGIPRCSMCHARLDTGMLPHICTEVFYQAMPMPSFTPFEVADESQA